MLKDGDRAPDFTLPDQDNNPVTLSGFKGKKVVVYFYPKDDTPGCTKEACSFRDANDLYLAKGAVVLGISADDAESHQKFRKKYNLPFHLLSDNGHQVLEQYGVWGKKNLYGKIIEGITRSTFIVDENGIIIKAFPKVNPEGHAEEVLKFL
jgi:thioredoxin-dependent peroxiredoxin